MKLGAIATNIRCRDTWKQHRNQLEELGFDYRNQTTKKRIL
jgi:hypothetical protein